jgi:hypothetical protein
MSFEASAPSGQPRPNSCYEPQPTNGKYEISWFTGGEGKPGLVVDIQAEPHDANNQQIKAFLVKSLTPLWKEGGSEGYQDSLSGKVTIFGNNSVMHVWGGNISATKDGGFSLVPISDQTAQNGPTFKNIGAFAHSLV